jgi:glycerophosphoryl diester phosphodiesterase
MSQCAQIPLKQWGVPVLTKKFIEIAKKQNKLVHVWTIDDKDKMFELIEFGVDGLMTDKPSVLKEAMVEKGLF